MKKYLYITLVLFNMCIVFTSCKNKVGKEQESTNKQEEEKHEDDVHASGNSLELSEAKVKELELQTDTLKKRSMMEFIEVNGKLEVPPQHEATVTAVLGVNIKKINVIEGDKVTKGQVLAWVSHPNLISLQTDYIKAYNDMVFLQQDYERQERLHKAGVSSGKTFQSAKAAYQSAMGLSKGYESQLRYLNIDPISIRTGNIKDMVPVTSPIKGYIEKVEVNIGQYVNPQDKMFMVVDNDHVHVDLMVFEKDVYKLKVGQEIDFTVQSIPGKHLTGKIYSVGKQFEASPKAIHVHAELDNKGKNLIPGMYVNGRIKTEENKIYAVPEEAIVLEEDKSFIFMVREEIENNEKIWKLTPVEIKTGVNYKNWEAIEFVEEIPDNLIYVSNKAYYLISEIKKGSASHSH